MRKKRMAGVRSGALRAVPAGRVTQSWCLASGSGRPGWCVEGGRRRRSKCFLRCCLCRPFRTFGGGRRFPGLRFAPPRAITSHAFGAKNRSGLVCVAGTGGLVCAPRTEERRRVAAVHIVGA
jgi:hypothetical protein